MKKSMLEVVWRGGSRGARWVPALLGGFALWTVSASVAAEHRREHADPVLRVDFEDCSEFAGITSVPAGPLRARVPARYSLAGDGTNAVLVVRVSQCQRVVVGEDCARSATVSQIGVSVTAPDGSAGPDATADINNYTLAYATDDIALARELERAGVDARYDPDLSYELSVAEGSSEGSLEIVARRPRRLGFSAGGGVVLPSTDPVPFVATWWGQAGRGDVEMRTVFGAIRFGSAAFTLHAAEDSQLAEFIGDTGLDFDLLDSFNTFGDARMIVTKR
jgi:hypothetical protein